MLLYNTTLRNGLCVIQLLYAHLYQIYIYCTVYIYMYVHITIVRFYCDFYIDYIDNIDNKIYC